MVRTLYHRSHRLGAVRLTLRWNQVSGQWVLRRGPYRMTASRDWHEVYDVALRVADRERKEAARRAYLAEVVPGDR